MYCVRRFIVNSAFLTQRLINMISFLFLRISPPLPHREKRKMFHRMRFVCCCVCVCIGYWHELRSEQLTITNHVIQLCTTYSYIQHTKTGNSNDGVIHSMLDSNGVSVAILRPYLFFFYRYHFFAVYCNGALIHLKRLRGRRTERERTTKAEHICSA